LACSISSAASAASASSAGAFRGGAARDRHVLAGAMTAPSRSVRLPNGHVNDDEMVADARGVVV
jgi:hypothetical protein